VLNIGAKRFVIIGEQLCLHIDRKTEMSDPSTREGCATGSVGD
jgi:hypothetical protein